MQSEEPKQVGERLAIALTWLCALIGVAYFAHGHLFSLYDDAYIYFRYIDNLLDGCGLRYNCNASPVEGFTSPLYLALLVSLTAVGLNPESASQVLGIVSALAAVLQAAALVRLLVRPLIGPVHAAFAGFIVALWLVSDGFFLLHALIGLETMLAAWLIVLAVDLHARQRPLLAIAGALLAWLARPEAFVLLALLLPNTNAQVRRKAWAIAASGVLAIEVTRLAIFGEWLPNTYFAKAGGTPRHVELGLNYVVTGLAEQPMLLAPVLALLIAAMCGRLTSFLRMPIGRLVVTFVAVQTVWLTFLVRVGGDTFLYGRLLLPLVALATALGLAGWIGVYRLACERWPQWRHWPRLAVLLFVGILLAGLAHGWQHAVPEARGFANVRRWTQLGHYLGLHYAGQSLATVPIGAIGYFSRLEVIDLVGLTEPEIARAGTTVPPHLLTPKWIGHERHNLAYVAQQAPDLIVFSRYAEEPWRDLSQVKAGFFAEWLLLQEIRAGRLPYELVSLPVAEDLQWLVFERRGSE